MRKLIWMLAALLTLAPAAFAQTAQEMTDRCAFSSGGKKTLDRMTDGDYRTYWASSSNGSAYVEIEAEDAIGGVYVQFYDDAAALDVQTRDASGAWQTVAQTDGAFLAAYAAVDAGAKTVRIRPKDGKGRLFIPELRVLGEGDAPGRVGGRGKGRHEQQERAEHQRDADRHRPRGRERPDCPAHEPTSAGTEYRRGAAGHAG